LVTDSSRCEQHRVARRRAYDAIAGTAHQRGYGKDWRDCIAAFRRGTDLDPHDPDFAEKLLARNRCAHCWAEGRRTVHNLEIDHMTPLKQGGARLDPQNLQPLCDSHHRIKSWREQRG
jgi:5-methylcytosine-specific restriction protein A